MKEKIYFISDIEMGRGDITDDFSDDELVCDFLAQISSPDPDTTVALVLNGDIFDFLKMCYKDAHPRYITEEVSLWKLEETIKAHKRVFAALGKFLKNPLHKVHFVIGNHDTDLAWPSLRERLRRELENHDRLTFDYQYENKEIRAEHGHLQDVFFSHRTHRPITSYKGQKILDLPWGSYAVFTHLVHLKKKYPHEERLFPNPMALKQNKEFAKESKKTTWRLALRSILLDPVTHMSDPTYKVPYGKFARHLLKYGFEFIDDEKFIASRAAEIMKKHPDKKVLILGHAHVRETFEKNGQKVIVTDTWRDEFDLRNNKTKKTKTYAQIEYNNGTLMSAQLKQWKV